MKSNSATIQAVQTVTRKKSQGRSVEVKTYGRWMSFPSRKKALDFFMEGAFSCEGAERDRYMNVCMKLRDGYRRCTDDWDINN